MLPGLILTGAGVGLTLPTLMATAAASLPPHAFATGSAVITVRATDIFGASVVTTLNVTAA